MTTERTRRFIAPTIEGYEVLWELWRGARDEMLDREVSARSMADDAPAAPLPHRAARTPVLTRTTKASPVAAA